MKGPAIGISIPCVRWRESIATVEALCRNRTRAALSAPTRFETLAESSIRDNLARIELSIVLGDDAMLRDLNKRYRNKDRATNVLSFSALDGDVLPPEGPIVLGDIIIAYETTKSEADDQGKKLEDHLSHLLIHGVLHLLGHDHEQDEEAEEMEGLERAILARLGIDDPYEAMKIETTP